MDFVSPCFNTYNNINYRQKSQTLQPYEKQFLINKYFASQMAQIANYANVPVDREEPPMMHQRGHSHSRSHHHHIHNRSHSQHYYHTMYPANDLNNYYNISNIGPAIITPRSRHSPINEPPPPIHNPAQLDCITLMQIWNELGNNIDCPPPMPPSRNYSISNAREGLFKVMFPHSRMMKADYNDPTSRTFIKSGDIVSVLGPSKVDRAKFTVCYKDRHVDLPHQLTQPPQIATRWS